MDSEDENFNNDEGVNLAGFLFGNIDESGQLESDVFDSESQKYISSLGRLGLGSFIREVFSENNEEEDAEMEMKDNYDEDCRSKIAIGSRFL